MSARGAWKSWTLHRRPGSASSSTSCKPFEAHNVVVFSLEPKGDATTVTWSMEGPTPFFGKIIHVFLDMDKMVGNDFEAGLANLKTASEK